jgi:hypothetical protein
MVKNSCILRADKGGLIQSETHEWWRGGEKGGTSHFVIVFDRRAGAALQFPVSAVHKH